MHQQEGTRAGGASRFGMVCSPSTTRARDTNSAIMSKPTDVLTLGKELLWENSTLSWLIMVDCPPYMPMKFANFPASHV